jgi:eukaryotic translation initiation factor 2-alpha kinase 4
VVQLLDASGNLLQLPYDLTLPHARQLARQTPSLKRTFVCGAAYRDSLNHSPPTANEEVDFDIVTLDPDDDPALDEAEVLKVMDEVVGQIPTFAASANICFHLNHSAILDAVLETCRIPLPQQPTVKEIISRLGYHQMTWSKMRIELRKFGLPDTTLDDLAQFDFRDSPERAFRRLRDLFQNASQRTCHKLEHGIRTLVETLTLVAQLDLQRKMYISPLASVHAKLYEGGMLFQCVMDRKINRSVIAAGGRYDSLIQAHRSIHRGVVACRGAVGLSIGLDQIVLHMALNMGDGGKSTFLKDKKKKKSAEPLPKRCDVLVEAVGTVRTEAVKAIGLKVGSPRHNPVPPSHMCLATCL